MLGWSIQTYIIVYLTTKIKGKSRTFVWSEDGGAI